MNREILGGIENLVVKEMQNIEFSEGYVRVQEDLVEEVGLKPDPEEWIESNGQKATVWFRLNFLRHTDGVQLSFFLMN